jgi:hypothetical protein
MRPYMYAANETMMPVRMPFWILGANASVATNVAVAATPSSDSRASCAEGLEVEQLNTREHDDRRAAPAWEVVEQRREEEQRQQTRTPRSRATRVLSALPRRLSADRENDPLTGIDWQNAAAILAIPCPPASWFSSQRTRVLLAIALQLDMASMKLMRAMTKAAGSSAVIALHSSAGTPTPGAPAECSPRSPAMRRESGESRSRRSDGDADQHAGKPAAHIPERDEHRDRRQAESRATRRAACPSA